MLKPEATAQPNLGSRGDMKCVVGGLSSPWRDRAVTFLQAGCSNEGPELSVAAARGSRSGLRQQWNWINPGGLRNCSMLI